jgi:hypothetical protein
MDLNIRYEIPYCNGQADDNAQGGSKFKGIYSSTAPIFPLLLIKRDYAS